MIRLGSILNVIDNTGVQKVKCLKVYNKLGLGNLGDLLLLLIKRVLSRKKYKRGERYKGLLVNVCRLNTKRDGTFFKFNKNNVILFNRKMIPLASKIKGPLYFRIRFSKFKRLTSLVRFMV